MPAEAFSAGIPPLRKLGVLLFLLCLFALALAGGTLYLLFHDLPLIQQAISETLAQTMKELQDALYADGREGIVIVLQAMDAAGKDSTIKHVTAPPFPSPLPGRMQAPPLR